MSLFDALYFEEGKQKARLILHCSNVVISHVVPHSFPVAGTLEEKYLWFLNRIKSLKKKKINSCYHHLHNRSTAASLWTKQEPLL